MEFKVVVSDPKTGKSYQRELKDEAARKFKNLDLGAEVDGSAVGLPGYKLKVTGGSDKTGSPMRQGVHGAVKPRILISSGVGYKPKRDVRKRKRVRGEKIDDDIVQVNTAVISYGSKPIEELFGVKEEESGEQTGGAGEEAAGSPEGEGGGET